MDKTRILEAYERIGGAKNKVVGGDFATNPFQEGETFVSPGSGVYVADQWQYGTSGAGAVTISRVAGESDGRKALRIEVTTADASLAASDLYIIQQRIVGFSIIPLLDGAAISFRVRSNITGLLAVSLKNAGADRSFVSMIDILVANQWQDAIIIVPDFDNTGTWDYEDGLGLTLGILMATGSDRETSVLDSWETGNFVSHSTSVNRMAANTNFIEFDQSQLEVGNIATDFENLDRDDVVEACQYFFAKTFDIDVVPAEGVNNYNGAITSVSHLTFSGTSFIADWKYPVTMRTNPSIITFGPGTVTNEFWRNIGNTTSYTRAIGSIGDSMVRLQGSHAADGTVAIHVTANARL